MACHGGTSKKKELNVNKQPRGFCEIELDEVVLIVD